MGDKLFKVGEINSVYSAYVGAEHLGKPIMQSSGLQTHLQKRHPNDLQYFSQVSAILSSPDYVGVNPNEPGTSFEVVKVLADNVRVGVKIDVSNEYFYVSTLFSITTGKLQHNIANNRLNPV